jgi:hypothetical protein
MKILFGRIEDASSLAQIVVGAGLLLARHIECLESGCATAPYKKMDVSRCPLLEMA